MMRQSIWPWSNDRVQARCTIHPNPLEDDGEITLRGDVGFIQDIDESNGVLFVDFDGRIVMATADELKPA